MVHCTVGLLVLLDFAWYLIQHQSTGCLKKILWSLIFVHHIYNSVWLYAKTIFFSHRKFIGYTFFISILIRIILVQFWLCLLNIQCIVVFHLSISNPKRIYLFLLHLPFFAVRSSQNHHLEQQEAEIKNIVKTILDKYFKWILPPS